LTERKKLIDGAAARDPAKQPRKPLSSVDWQAGKAGEEMTLAV
jgi:hypothetical protein